MKKLFILLVICALGGLSVSAEEAAVNKNQKINNDDSDFSVNLNSQIREDGQLEEQTITNVGSKFNVNINRNTYKFYYKVEDAETLKKVK